MISTVEKNKLHLESHTAKDAQINGLKRVVVKLMEERMDISKMSYRNKVELCVKLWSEIIQHDCLKQSFVDSLEDMDMQLQNEVFPALLAADYKYRMDSAEDSFSSDREYFNKGLV